MAHVLPTRLGSSASRPLPPRLRRSWHLIAGVDAASGVGMVLIGIAVSGLAQLIAVVLGCLVLVESGYLVVRLHTGAGLPPPFARRIK